MDVNDLRIAVTVLSLAVFLGLLAWVLQTRHRPAFDAAARMPLNDDPQPADRPLP